MFIIVLMDVEQKQMVRAIPVRYSVRDEAMAHANMLTARARKTQPRYQYFVRSMEDMEAAGAAAPDGQS